ncbi:uncharacterized protein LOC105664099 [Megachile rotundata]|uniref:uncharacterized protein LOC105664099 n=1 Tax=Megachile rotundata TaxID=143995 RepID=UPI003FD0DBED
MDKVATLQKAVEEMEIKGDKKKVTTQEEKRKPEETEEGKRKKVQEPHQQPSNNRIRRILKTIDYHVSARQRIRREDMARRTYERREREKLQRRLEIVERELYQHRERERFQHLRGRDALRARSYRRTRSPYRERRNVAQIYNNCVIQCVNKN